MEQSNFAKLISNYGSKLWSMVSVFFFIPLYIKFLGNENYGLIGFYALLLGIISFADAGMSSAIVREFSQKSSSNYKYSVFKNLERIYIIVCLLIILIIFISEDFVVKHWLSSKSISYEELKFNVRLISFGITTQLISSLYYGALFSLNNQVRSNTIQLLWGIFRTAFVFIVFIILYSSIKVYFVWQIICNIIYVFTLRFFLIRQLKFESDEGKLVTQFNKVPKHIINYIGGMLFIAIISAINSQADKLVTSSLFDLEIFGFYNIASSLAQLPVILVAPLMAFAFPLLSKFSNLDNSKGYDKTKIVFEKIFFLINTTAVIFTISIFFYSKEILILWTKNVIPESIFSTINYDVKLLIVGSFFLGLQFPLYYLLLSKGKTIYTIKQGVFQIVLGIPLLYFFSTKFGLYGVPIPWLLINIAAFIYLFLIVNKKYLDFFSMKFFQRLFIMPILISFVVNILLFYLYKQLLISFIPFILAGIIFSLALILITYNYLDKRKIFDYENLYDFPND